MHSHCSIVKEITKSVEKSQAEWTTPNAYAIFRPQIEYQKSNFLYFPNAKLNFYMEPHSTYQNTGSIT